MRLEHLLIVSMLIAVPACSETDAIQPAIEGDNHDLSVTDESSGGAAAQPQGPTTAVGAVTVTKVANLQETDELVASQMGKVVVVDLWALW